MTIENKVVPINIISINIIKKIQNELLFCQIVIYHFNIFAIFTPKLKLNILN